jgi:hypothetical protein
VPSTRNATTPLRPRPGPPALERVACAAAIRPDGLRRGGVVSFGGLPSTTDDSLTRLNFVTRNACLRGPTRQMEGPPDGGPPISEAWMFMHSGYGPLRWAMLPGTPT